jgi:hypothetical protein
LFPFHQILNIVLPFIPNCCHGSFYLKFLFPNEISPWFRVPDSQYCFLCTKFLILFRLYQMLNTVPYVLNSRYWFSLSSNYFHYDPFMSVFSYFQTKLPHGSLFFEFLILLFL